MVEMWVGSLDATKVVMTAELLELSMAAPMVGMSVLMWAELLVSSLVGLMAVSTASKMVERLG